MAVQVNTLPALFARNRAALIDLPRFWGLPWNEFRPDTYGEWAPTEWANHMPQNIDDDINIWYDNTGWTDYLLRCSVDSEGLLLATAYTQYRVHEAPVFLRGKEYRLISGDDNSADNFKMLRITHPAIPRVIPLIYNQRIHLLLEPMNMSALIAWLYDIATSDRYYQLLLRVTVQTLEAVNYLHNQGYSLWDPDDVHGDRDDRGLNIYVNADEHDRPNVMVLPGFCTFRDGRWRVTDDDALVRVFRIARDTQPPQNFDEKTASKEELKAYHTVSYWLQGESSIDYKAYPEHVLRGPRAPAPPEYTLPEVKGVSDGLCRDAFNLEEKDADAPEELKSDYGALEVTMAIASKGLYVNGHDPLQTFLQHLGEFGYIRSPVFIFMDSNEWYEYGKDTRLRCSDLLSYQSNYERLSSEGINRSICDRCGDRDVEGMPECVACGPASPEQKRRETPIYRGISSIISGVPRREYAPFNRTVALRGSSPAYTDESRWEVVGLPHEAITPSIDTISIHGVEFDAVEIADVFAQTPLATAVEYGTREYDPPYLSAQDVSVIQDFLDGLIMPYTFYTELSDTAFLSLSGKESLLDLYEWLPGREKMNYNWNLGSRPAEHLDSIREAIQWYRAKQE